MGVSYKGIDGLYCFISDMELVWQAKRLIGHNVLPVTLGGLGRHRTGLTGYDGLSVFFGESRSQTSN